MASVVEEKQQNSHPHFGKQPDSLVMIHIESFSDKARQSAAQVRFNPLEAGELI